MEGAPHTTNNWLGCARGRPHIYIGGRERGEAKGCPKWVRNPHGLLPWFAPPPPSLYGRHGKEGGGGAPPFSLEEGKEGGTCSPPPFLSLGLVGLVEGRTSALWAGLSPPLAHNAYKLSRGARNPFR